MILITGALLLFVLVLGYIQRYGYQIESMSPEQALLVVLLASGTVALGGISDGQRWGKRVWGGVTLLLLVHPLLFAWHGLLWRVTPVLLVMHSMMVLCGVGSRTAGAARESV